jgi:hypothetical protein
MNELDQVLKQDALQQSSATRIQNAVRNSNALNETISRATQKRNTAMDGSECWRDRPGFGCHAVSQKLRENNIYIVVPVFQRNGLQIGLDEIS